MTVTRLCVVTLDFLLQGVCMPFTGKATYSAGATLPEIAEDVSDLVSISSPHETPLLDALGDPMRDARSTVHEWLEDALLPDSAAVTAVGGTGNTLFTTTQAARFRVGDQLLIDGSTERVLVTSVELAEDRITVVRGYGGTTSATSVGTITILGNAALEGNDASAVRFTNRVRKSNYTQIFTATCEVSGSQLAVKQLGVRDELDYQKTLRMKELLRDLESSVINGVAPAANTQGSATVRRTMNGLRSFITTNRLSPSDGVLPENVTTLTEPLLNAALRSLWQGSSGQIDTIVVNGREKRKINEFVATNRRFFTSNETFKDMVSVYESDFGVCRVVLSRHVPPGTVLLLDSSRIQVLPLTGRSFHYKPLATSGDRDAGQLIGEYTLEFRNESAHGIIYGLVA